MSILFYLTKFNQIPRLINLQTPGGISLKAFSWVGVCKERKNKLN